jgi:hypothetical protein
VIFINSVGIRGRKSTAAELPVRKSVAHDTKFKSPAARRVCGRSACKTGLGWGHVGYGRTALIRSCARSKRSVEFSCNKLVFGKADVITMAFRIIGRVLLTPLLLITFLGYVGAACLAGWALNHNLDSPNAIGKYVVDHEREKEIFIRSCHQFDFKTINRIASTSS